MYNDNSEQEKCLSKIAYRTKNEAEARAQALRAVYGTKLYAYKCKFCGCFHLATDHNPDYPFWKD